MARRLPPLDPQDQALWDALKGQVRPLQANTPSAPLAAASQNRRAPQPPKKTKKPSSPDLIWQAPGTFALPKIARPSAPSSQPSDLRAGGSYGLDRAGAERLRRGRMPIEGTLDLHGLTQDQAKDRLEAFIQAAARAGKRMLLVITGKGLSKGGEGVLRARVPEWLGQGELGRQVLAFSYAQRRDGEQGALYVLLRRRG